MIYRLITTSILLLFFSISIASARIDVKRSSLTVSLNPGGNYESSVIINRFPMGPEKVYVYPSIEKKPPTADYNVIFDREPMVIGQSGGSGDFKFKLVVSESAEPGLKVATMLFAEYEDESREEMIAQEYFDINLTVLPRENLECHEDDSGMDYDKAGKTYNKNTIRTDRCDSADRLIEFHCDKANGFIRESRIFCPHGCIVGACLEEKSQPANIVKTNSPSNTNSSQPAVNTVSRTQDEIVEGGDRDFRRIALGFLVMFFGMFMLKYAYRLNNSEGGVSLTERLYGLVVIVIGINIVFLHSGFGFDKLLYVFIPIFYFLLVYRLSKKLNREKYNFKYKG